MQSDSFLFSLQLMKLRLLFISNNLISSQNPPDFVPLRMRRATLSGSRYLAHDLTDLPVPTEEWNVGKRKFQCHRNAVRSSSLQPQRQRPPVLRQSSTPTILESQYAVPRCVTHRLRIFMHLWKILRHKNI